MIEADAIFHIRTGNILVDADVQNKQLNKLIVLDWELAKTGPAATDVGQFAGECFMLQHLSPRSAGRVLLRSFLANYKNVVTSSINERSLPSTLFDPQNIVACTGAHAGVWGSLVSWGDETATRTTVETALVACKQAKKGDLQGVEVTEFSVLWTD